MLEKECNHQEENKLTFNITYYPEFQNTKTILEELQILLAPDKEHQKVFPNAPIVGFRNGKSLKDHLVRASFPILHSTLGSEPCEKRNCQVCQFIVNTDTFSPITTDETFKVSKGPLNCNSKKFIWQHRLKTFFPNGLNEREESCL